MKVALIVGHSYKKQGAYGNAGYSEYRYWDEFLSDLVSRLGKQNDVKIFHRGRKGRYSSKMRVLHNEIDEWGADVAISCHFNASNNRRVNGHEVLYDGKNERSKEMAKVFDNAFDKYLKNRDRNLLDRHTGRGGAWLRGGKSANILIEPYFASHQKTFMKKGKGYEALMFAMLECVKLLAFGTISTDTPPPAPEYHNYHLSTTSLRNLEETNRPRYIATVFDAIKITTQDFSVVEGGRLKPYPRKGDSQKVLDAIVKVMTA